MAKRFLNISNHPSSKWSASQKEAALKLAGEIVDIQFPNIPTSADTKKVFQMAQEMFNSIHSEDVVMVMGELSFCVYLINMIRALGAVAVVAVTERKSIESQVDGKTIKNTVFEFAGFREI